MKDPWSPQNARMAIFKDHLEKFFPDRLEFHEKTSSARTKSPQKVMVILGGFLTPKGKPSTREIFILVRRDAIIEKPAQTAVDAANLLKAIAERKGLTPC